MNFKVQIKLHSMMKIKLGHAKGMKYISTIEIALGEADMSYDISDSK